MKSVVDLFFCVVRHGQVFRPYGTRIYFCCNPALRLRRPPPPIRAKTARLQDPGACWANLLDMAKLKSGAIVPNTALHDISEIVGSALRRASKILSRHKVSLELDAVCRCSA